LQPERTQPRKLCWPPQALPSARGSVHGGALGRRSLWKPHKAVPLSARASMVLAAATAAAAPLSPPRGRLSTVHTGHEPVDVLCRTGTVHPDLHACAAVQVSGWHTPLLRCT